MKYSSSKVGAVSLVLVVIAVAVASAFSLSPNPSKLTNEGNVTELDVETSAELRDLFSKYGYEFPPQTGQTIPPLIAKSIPRDFPAIKNAKLKKRLFVQLLLPIVLLENQRLREQRVLALAMLGHNSIPQDKAGKWLKKTLRQYKVSSQDTTAAGEILFRRLDELPVELVIAQAAIESGWGTSRFALEGNSLFGQWTYREGDGLTPENRDEDARHQVKTFPHLQASVRSYMHNINTNHAYRELRGARAAMRRANETLSAKKLAEGLHRYSQRGHDYAKEIQQLLRLPSLVAVKDAALRTPQVVSTDN